MWQANSCPHFARETWPPIRACNLPAIAQLHLIGAFGG